MKTFKKAEINEVQAIQYGTHEEATKIVSLCYKEDYDGKIYEVPRDLMGKPKNAFTAVKTSTGWTKIKEGDWIVQKDNQWLVVENGVFQLLFKEV